MSLMCEQVGRAALGEPLRRKGHELLWRCPNHDDKDPSLSVNPAKNVWACFPCGKDGTPWQLAAFLAGVEAGDKAAVKAWLSEHGLSDVPTRKTKASGRGPLVATYVYKDENGNLLARKFRYEPGADGKKKSFAWERWENGQWVTGLGSVKTPLYRIAEIANEPLVILTEGEKDADAGGNIDLPTTTSGGTGSWREDHAECLRGKSVVIIAHADEPGRVEAYKRAASLYGKAEWVKVIEIPGAKDLAEAIEKGTTAERIWDLIEAARDWKPAGGAELLRRFGEIFQRYIVAAKGVPLVGALYAFMTHSFEVFSWIGYLCFSSPLESCGKSHAADIVGWASARPEILVSITEAALFRLITKVKPTVVVDEAEVLSGDGETAIALNAVLHAGCAPDDGIVRCAPNTFEVEKFSPFCPKIFCQIGKLPRVLASRCIDIEMKRKKPTERVSAFIRRKVREEAQKLGAEITVWVSQHQEEIRRAYESLPDESFEDRGRENFAPLEAILTVADPERLPELAQARQGLTKVSDAALSEDSIEVRLLSDIGEVFSERKVDELGSESLADALVGIKTSPWPEWSRGKPLSPAKLAGILRKFGIRPDRIGSKESRARGYALARFQDAFTRYLPNRSVQVSTDSENSGDGEGFEGVHQSPVDTSENAVSPAKNAGGGRVDTLKGGNGEKQDQKQVKKVEVEWEA